jgi:SAM-dependent methyltransferase
MINKVEDNWFVDWFNTPFYHDLYRHRDHAEAMKWMHKILEIVPLEKDLPILDVCCGNGRHALCLEKLGYSIFGIDIGVDNIQKAQSNSQFPERWKAGDARDMQWPMSFQLVTNLFTSFGYFNETSENRKLFLTLLDQVGEGGYMMLDFLNAPKVIQNLIPSEIVQGELTEYCIQRKIHQRQIIKSIDFEYNSHLFSFHEKVYLFDKDDFLEWIQPTSFDLIHHLGDYNANEYQVDSPRSIFVFQKK